MEVGTVHGPSISLCGGGQYCGGWKSLSQGNNFRVEAATKEHQAGRRERVRLGHWRG